MVGEDSRRQEAWWIGASVSLSLSLAVFYHTEDLWEIPQPLHWGVIILQDWPPLYTHTPPYPSDMSQCHSSGVCTGERKSAREGKRCSDKDREQKSAWNSAAEVLLLHIPQMEISLLMFHGNRRFQTSQEQETGDQTNTGHGCDGTPNAFLAPSTVLDVRCALRRAFKQCFRFNSSRVSTLTHCRTGNFPLDHGGSTQVSRLGVGDKQNVVQSLWYSDRKHFMLYWCIFFWP